MDTIQHQSRTIEAKAYHDKQKKKKAKKEKPFEEYYVVNGKKVIRKIRLTKDGSLYSVYVGQKRELKAFLKGKKVISYDDDRENRMPDED